MPIIKIDEVEYELDLLSKEMRAQLSSVQSTDQKIVELQRDLAIAQTARASYATALRKLLDQASDVSLQPLAEEHTRH